MKIDKEPISKDKILKGINKNIIRVVAPDETGLCSAVIGDKYYYFGSESSDYETRSEFISRIGGWEAVIDDIYDIFEGLRMSGNYTLDRLPERNQYGDWLYCREMLKNC